MSQLKDVCTIAEVVHFATKAAAEAHREVFNQTHNGQSADSAARMAFRMNLPVLETRASVQAYLAVVVRGIELHLIGVRESQQMVKAARLWITADQQAGRVATLTAEVAA